jgi:SPX domain protein involved in polyphosphate accumulation
MPLPAYLLPDVMAWVRVHPAQWRVAFPPRQVNNVYFDSPVYSGLNGNLSGVGARTKLRLRWYGPELARVEAGANLELKRKEGAAGWKEIAAVAGPLDLAGQAWREILVGLRADVTPAAGVWLDHFSIPMLVSHYRRSYYVTPDGGVRLTVDSDLAAYDQRAAMAPNLDRPARLDAAVVVELKAPLGPGVARRLSEILGSLPGRVDRFSKYVHGVLAASAW